MLRGDEQFPSERGFSGAAVQGFFGGEAREMGIVVFLGNVREDKIARAGIETLGIGEEFADSVIRKMPGAGEHALLDDPGIWADFEHVEIVIGLQDEAIGLAEMDFDELGHVAKIGADGNLGAISAEGEAEGIGGIVRDSEGVDDDIANGKTLPGVDGFDAAEAFAEGFREDAAKLLHGGLGDVERRFPEAEDLREAVTMVGMLVSNEHGVEAVEVAFDGRESGEGFALAKAGVNKDAGGFRFEQRDIARTARGEDGNAKADKKTPSKNVQAKLLE